jgi:Tfp pilus assembly protein PilX
MTTRERGAALVTALFLMLAVLMLGVSAARTALGAGKSARLERDRHIAFQAAQAALADAELDIAGGADPASARAAAFGAGGAAAFAEGCHGAEAMRGLCRAAAAATVPAWQAADLSGDAAVPYGRFTGAALPTGRGILPARLPRYIIERLTPAADDAGRILYRVTAIGFGPHGALRVVLQSVGRHAPAGGPLPGKRISWREIANWPELHAAAASMDRQDRGGPDAP